MKQINFLILIFLSTLTFPSLAQNPAHFILGEKHFTNIDIYTLFFDDNSDILYTGTNSGVYAYKQNKFIRIKETKEQIGSSFFQLKQDKNGVVFCCNLNGQIFKIVENKMILFYQMPPDEITTGFFFYFVENNIIAATRSKIIRINTEGESELLLDGHKKNPFSGDAPLRLFDCQQTQNGDVYIPIYSEYSTYSLLYRNGQLKKVISPFPTQKSYRITYLSLQDFVFSVNKKGSFKSTNPSFQSKVEPILDERLFPIGQNEVAGLGIKKGTRILSLQNDTLVEKQSFFEKHFTSAICTNKNGTLFLGSFGEGIKVIPNKKITQPRYDHHFLGIASSPDNEVYLSTRGGEIFQNKNGLQLIDKRNNNIDRVFYLQEDFNIKDIPKKNIFYDTPLNSIGAVKDLHQIDSNKIIITMLGTIALLTKDKNIAIDNLHYHLRRTLTPNIYFLFPPQRFTSVTWSPLDSTFYCANAFGVFARTWSSPKQDFILWEGDSFLGNDLEYYNNQLICATEKMGVLFFKNKIPIAQLTQKDGLKSNSIKRILVRDGLLYILTKAGMQIYNLERKVFLGLGVAEGLINDGVTNFTLSNDKLWLMEKHRFYAIDIASFSNTQKENPIAKLYIDSILINGQSIDHHHNNTFTYDKNEMNILVDYRNIESKAETKIQYTLEGFYDNWKTLPTFENNIEFQSLPIGNYNLKIKAVYRNQTTDTFNYSFEILPPVWQRWWFYLLFTFSVILISTIIFRYILKRQRQELAVKNELNNSKLTAIRSQMNPHFIFNALNSIQHLVLKGDVDNSYSFINKFASLVRKTLEFSEEEFITLAEEIKLIEVYLLSLIHI